MKYLKKEDKKKVNPLLLPVIVLSVLVVVLTAALLWPSDTEEPAELPGETTTSTPAGALAVETPYATLHYPAQWAGNVRAEVQKDTLGAQVHFYGSVNGRETWIFTVGFGGGEGTPVGIYQTREGYGLDVTVEYSLLDLNSSWSTEEIDALCAMQEGVNQLLELLEEDPGFTAA